MKSDVIEYTSIRPKHYLSLLSQREIEQLTSKSNIVYQLFRRCVLAVLNSGAVLDDMNELLAKHADFDVRIVQQPRGLKLELFNAPASAFVNRRMIQGIQDHVFAALRDIVYCQDYHQLCSLVDDGADTTELVFNILRNAEALRNNKNPNLVVCWGGHSISRQEYDFTKEVGYQLGLRGMNIGTGCGIGAMKGPMKGAAVGHAKQKNHEGRYIGITEPGIIAAEPPNSLVNELVILPDIEKRLEAFVRLAHVIVVFPGGPGTAEEILYVLGILMQEKNRDLCLPLIFACAKEQESYFLSVDRFLRDCLGEEVAKYYQILVGSPEHIAETVLDNLRQVKQKRLVSQESFSYHWQLTIPAALQRPFIANHKNMADLPLFANQPKEQLCIDLRAAFSGIVAGNVKPDGIKQVQQFGPFLLNADPVIGKRLGQLLQDFIQQGRMQLKQGYTPCFKIN